MGIEGIHLSIIKAIDDKPRDFLLSLSKVVNNANATDTPNYLNKTAQTL